MQRVSHLHNKSRRRDGSVFFEQIRAKHDLPERKESLITQATGSHEEYIRLLDYYSDSMTAQKTWNISHIPEPNRPPRNTSAADTLPENDLSPAISTSQRRQAQPAIDHLVDMLQDENTSFEAIVEAYLTIPSPGVAYLRENVRRLLFHRLSAVEVRNKERMIHYFSIMEDMKAANLRLIEAEWNSAIAFAGRCYTVVQASDVEVALRTWKKMEHEAEVPSGEVTFNILFDVSIRAGKFVLAEMILREMEARKLPLNRFARTTIILYHGLKGDGDGVRRAYRAFVEAGEIVDLVVLNCVIVSFIRSGEFSAAANVYERMKSFHKFKTGSSIQLNMTWRQTRDLGRLLDRSARRYRTNAEKLRQIQDEQYLAPNLHTYAILIDYHVSRTGELVPIASFLKEMQARGVPLHGRIFVKLFKGFAYYGDRPHTAWTYPRLDSVFESLLNALDDPAQGGTVTVETWMVIWAVRAYSVCGGTRAAFRAWAELKQRWLPTVAEEAAVKATVGRLLGIQGR